MMSEGPSQLNIFTTHVTANVSVSPFVSTSVDVPYPNEFTYMLKTFSLSEAAVSFKNNVVTLNNGKFAVFGGTFVSFVFCLCFAFDA